MVEEKRVLGQPQGTATLNSQDEEEVLTLEITEEGLDIQKGKHKMSVCSCRSLGNKRVLEV